MQDVRLNLDYEELLATYYKARLANDALGMVKRGLFGDDEADDRKLKRAAYASQIAANRKKAGLPYSDDDYEDALNDDSSFKNYGHAAVFGKHLSDKLPSLRHFGGSTTAAIAPNLLSPLTKGNRYGRIAGTVGRIFGFR